MLSAWLHCVMVVSWCLEGTAGDHNKAMIAAVLPQDPSRLFSIAKVRPAASIAIERVHADGLLSSCHLDIHYKDSKCSEAAGMNEAINFFVEGRTSVFFGPVCDYAAAPVARQIGFWNVPMVSVGAMALDFFTRRQAVYPLLTRAGPANLQSLAQSFIRLMDDYAWTKVKVLYERDGRGEIVSAFCHLASEALVYGIPKTHISLDYYRLETVSWKRDKHSAWLNTTLIEEVGDEYSGKWTTSPHLTSGDVIIRACNQCQIGGPIPSWVRPSWQV